MSKSTRWSCVGFWAASAALISLTSFARPASAHSWGSRALTLPGSTFELGLGLGLGHLDIAERTGLGVNLELGYGITSGVELRFRTGLRLGENGRVVDGDYFGRPFYTETYNLGADTIANPQLGLRISAVRSGSLDLGIDAHVIFPLDDDTDLGMLLGLPLAVRLGDRLRLDTGLFLPIRLTEPDTTVDISIPFHVWIKVNPSTTLGPLTGVYFYDGGGRGVPFGFGVGSSIAYDAEVRFWLLFSDISNDESRQNFGVGAGLYVLF
jgi:hypothetical protein